MLHGKQYETETTYILSWTYNNTIQTSRKEHVQNTSMGINDILLQWLGILQVTWINLLFSFYGIDVVCLVQ